MAKPRNDAIDLLVYVLFRTVAMFVHMLRVPTAYACARRLGDLLFAVDRRHRELAIEQISRSFPDWPRQRVREVARESLRSVIMLGLETLLMPRLITPNRWAQHVRFAHLDPVLRPLVTGEHGMILLTGHFGNWEVGGYTMATLGFPTVAVARRLDNPYLDRFVLGVRERTGLRIVDKKGAAAEADGVLRDGQTLCFIADQDAGRKGVFVDFFGRPASTFRTIALMALRHETPIAVGYARRLSDRFEFELGVTRVIRPADWADKDDEVRWITQEYTRELEDLVRNCPGQYFGWAHRRWKHQPKSA